jgi:hypothetical protein
MPEGRPGVEMYLVHHAAYLFYLQIGTKREPTSGLEPLS